MGLQRTLIGASSTAAIALSTALMPACLPRPTVAPVTDNAATEIDPREDLCWQLASRGYQPAWWAQDPLEVGTITLDSTEDIELSKDHCFGARSYELPTMRSDVEFEFDRAFIEGVRVSRDFLPYVTFPGPASKRVVYLGLSGTIYSEFIERGMADLLINDMVGEESPCTDLIIEALEIGHDQPKIVEKVVYLESLTVAAYDGRGRHIQMGKLVPQIRPGVHGISIREDRITEMSFTIEGAMPLMVRLYTVDVKPGHAGELYLSRPDKFDRAEVIDIFDEIDEGCPWDELARFEENADEAHHMCTAIRECRDVFML